MFGTNLVRRTRPDGFSILANRFFNDDVFWSGIAPACEGSDTGTQRANWNPSVDVHEETDAYVVTADLPGIQKNDVEVTVDDNVLSLTGERKFEERTEEDGYRRRERSFGKFSRRFRLPRQVDAAKVDATFKNGVLEIRVAKSEAAKSRSIKIQ